MILNKKKDLSDKVTVSNIVLLVMFGNDDLVNTCIDFVATTTPFSGMSFGPFLIQAAQVFGSKQIEIKSQGAIKDNVATVLTCQPALTHYYKRLGYKQYSPNQLKQGGTFAGAGGRLEIERWRNDTELIKMRITSLGSRSINHIS